MKKENDTWFFYTHSCLQYFFFYTPSMRGGGSGKAPTHQLAYDPLPCSPFSPEWKMLGNEVIRGYSEKCLSQQGMEEAKVIRNLE